MVIENASAIKQVGEEVTIRFNSVEEAARFFSRVTVKSMAKK